MRIKDIIRILLSLGTLLFIFSFIDISLLAKTVYMMNKPLLLLVISILPFSILIRSYRLKLILNKEESGITVRDTYRLNLVGLGLNIFMPASSGDIAKAYYGYKRHNIKETMLSSVIVDKLVAIFAILVIGLLSSLVLSLYSFSFIFLLLVAVFYFLTFHPSLIPWGLLNRIVKLAVKRNLSTDKLIHAYKMPPQIKLHIFALSLLGWFVTYVQFYLLCISFSVNVPFFYVLVTAPLITLARLFPLTFIGLGSQEAVVIYLFSLINITPTLSALVSLSFTTINLVMPGLLGMFLFASDRKVI